MQKVLEANPIAQQTFRIVAGKVKVTLGMKDIEAFCIGCERNFTAWDASLIKKSVSDLPRNRSRS